MNSALQSSVMLQGFVTGGGLIIAIGAQNAFLLAQGVRRQYHWPIALLCSLSDALLICLGVLGMGVLISESPLLLELARYGGALFLTYYGYRALRSALQPAGLDMASRGAVSLKSALLTTLAVSLLNPHAYLDTVVLLGSIATQYGDSLRNWFGAGAVLASFAWFLTLGLGAPKLAPLFRDPRAWRVLDSLVCLVMWGIALSLVL
ncbi:LysE/ArgO family amino acid transporter [Marinobacterium rhizophilum]|uniref:Amino acid transporter n=1 Tax=Marinobacterium rhizophilum TaxID=420402 RepID=A0ABY5HHI8_9GAMM|nr:LysE/ArgO family amino acid transporter [Marinobacterium rhizophilum]UTW11820.1 amino acid transporter [Marinobacterium rhizophilum]